MRKIFSLFTYYLLVSSTQLANAFDYDPLLMRAQASIFPKIIMLDKDLEIKASSNQIVITILHSRKEGDIAIKLQKLISQQYKNNLGARKLIINLVNYENFNSSINSTAYFLLKGPKEIHEAITSQASSQKRLVFSYDYKDFEHNTLVSVLMREKTYIYLNKSAVHDYGINFLPLFYKIVKVIE